MIYSGMCRSGLVNGTVTGFDLTWRPGFLWKIVNPRGAGVAQTVSRGRSGEPVDFRILGRLEVRTESGRVCTLVRRKQRVLLAVLLLNANRSVPMERIIDWLWEGQPPASAAQNLYNHISDLRRHRYRQRRPGADPESVRVLS